MNTWTYGDQYNARVARRANGDFWVVWEHWSSQVEPIDDQSIQLQGYASDGTPLGDQIQVNAYTTGRQDQADIAIQSNGDFVVVWRSFGSVGNDEGSWSIQGQQFASDGTPLGSQFQVNSFTTADQFRPRIAVDGMDRFLVVWDGASQSPGDTIQGQHFDAAAQPMGDPFLISSITVDELKVQAEVAMAADGSFVVVWEGRNLFGEDPSDESIQARRFNSLGVPLGPQFLVNDYTTGSQRRPSIDMLDNGAFIVVWDSERSTNGDGNGLSVQAQRFNSNGAPIGQPWVVNGGTAGTQLGPSVRYGKANDLVVLWSDVPNTGDLFWHVKGRRFSTSGEPLSDDFTSSTGEAFFVTNPHLAFDAQGNFVTVWHSPPVADGDIWDAGVRARRYCNPQCLFFDGFESGDTGGWINAVGN